jgi:hypothetical protein
VSSYAEVPEEEATSTSEHPKCIDLFSTNEASAPIMGARGIVRNVCEVFTFAHDRRAGPVADLNRKQGLGSLPAAKIQT